jgi:MFS family permease
MKKFNSKNLPYFGASVQAILFAIAGNEFFSVPIFGAIVGFGIGAVVNYSMALASSRVSDIAKSRKPLAYFSLVLLSVISPTVICSTLGWSVATFAWSISVDMAIILSGAIVGKGLLQDDEKPVKVARNKKGVAEKLPQVSETIQKPLPKVARRKITDDELLAYLAENKGQTQEVTAEYLGVTRQAVGARIKKLYAVKDK